MSGVLGGGGGTILRTCENRRAKFGKLRCACGVMLCCGAIAGAKERLNDVW